MSTAETPLLTPVEARVLGVLVEKQHAVPDSYPLSLNALVAGCNQKSSRDPVMELAESEVVAALDALKHATLVVESSGGRVSRYAHNLPRVLHVPTEAAALLAVLMLRGPQTPGELRINCERLHRFADVSSVEAYLEELSARDAGPLVSALPRQPGAREIRWTHLLCGPPPGAEAQAAGVAQAGGVAYAGAGSPGGLEARVAALEADVAALKAALVALGAEVPGH